MRCRIPVSLWPLNGRVVAGKSRTKRSVNRSQTWWIDESWYCPSLINFLALLKSSCFLASDGLSKFSTFADKNMIRLSSNLVLPWSDKHLITFHWISIVFCSLICRAVFAYLQTNCWLGLPQILWSNSLQVPPALINLWSCFTELLPFPGLSLVQQFPYICRQTADGFNLQSAITKTRPWLAKSSCSLRDKSIIEYACKSGMWILML